MPILTNSNFFLFNFLYYSLNKRYCLSSLVLILTFISSHNSFSFFAFHFFHPFHFGTNPQFNILICKKQKTKKLPQTIILKAFYPLKIKVDSFSLTFFRLMRNN